MNNLLKTIIYILTNYPKSEELSKPRLVKIIYLSDWKHAIDYGKQFTEIEWYFNHYGPYVEDVMATMKANPELFEIKTYNNPYGGITDKFKILKPQQVSLSSSIIESIDYVIYHTFRLNWTQFISTVYSSYPVANSSKYTILNLKDDSTKFRELHKLKLKHP